MKEIRNVEYFTDNEAQKLDILLPDGEATSVFLYFHGGGLESGDKNFADKFASYLTDRGIAVVSANYRMLPDYHYPDFLYDSALAVDYTVKYAKENLGLDKIYVGGSSAGGYISMMLCFDKRYLDSVGLDNSVIAGYLHDAGQPTAHFNLLKDRGLDSRRVIVDDTAPLYYIGLEKEYPRMRFIVSDNDMNNRYEQTMLTLATLSLFGYSNYDHTVMHGTHCEYCFKTSEDGQSVFGKMIVDFIKGN